MSTGQWMPKAQRRSTLCVFVKVLLALVVMAPSAKAIAATLDWSSPLYDGRQVAGPAGAGIPHVEIKTAAGSYLVVASRQEVYPGGKRVIAAGSDDGGKTWKDLGTIVDDSAANLDLGDGTMLYDSSVSPPTLYYVYRRNLVPRDNRNREYSIRVSVSYDNGSSWAPHSIVHKINPPDSRVQTGLWTPSLFRTVGTAEALQCLYDDGDLPDVLTPPGNVNRGQWSYVRKWNGRTRTWDLNGPTPLAAQSPAGRISAEGARTVVRVGVAGHLWSPVESSTGTAPHRAMVIRYTESYNSGKTWSLTQAANPDWTEASQEDGPFLHSKPPEVPGYPGYFYDWSWPLAARLMATKNTTNLMVAVVFRSDEDLPPDQAPSVVGGGGSNSATVDKKLFHLFSDDGAVQWTKGRISDDIILDHGVVALHDGSVLLGYSVKYVTPRKYVLRRGVVASGVDVQAGSLQRGLRSW